MDRRTAALAYLLAVPILAFAYLGLGGTFPFHAIDGLMVAAVFSPAATGIVFADHLLAGPSTATALAGVLVAVHLVFLARLCPCGRGGGVAYAVAQAFLGPLVIVPMEYRRQPRTC
ncbi:MAG: hypothetical protein ABEK12_04025 [Candidatus Nanohaloarchaea archaeon]